MNKFADLMNQNFMRNNMTGQTYDFGPSVSGPNLQFDYASGPVNVMGRIGYRTKNDPLSVYDQYTGQKIADLGVDQAATRQRQKENLDMQGKQLDNQIKQQSLDERLSELTGGKPRDLKLKQGEVWNPQTQAVESIPGSQLYIQQKQEFGKDLSTKSLANSTAKLAIDKIDEITKGNMGENYSDAFQNNFGGYNALLSQYIPGDTTDVRQKIASLKQNLKTAGLQLMRQGGSIGQMTEREWPIVEQSISAISPLLSEKEAAFQLAKVRTYMENLAQRANQEYQAKWGDTQFARDTPTQDGPMVGQVVKGYRFKGGDPSIQGNWEKVQ